MEAAEEEEEKEEEEEEVKQEKQEVEVEVEAEAATCEHSHMNTNAAVGTLLWNGLPFQSNPSKLDRGAIELGKAVKVLSKCWQGARQGAPQSSLVLILRPPQHSSVFTLGVAKNIT